MGAVSKQEADAHDRLVDAGMELADLILAAGISIDERDLEELTFFLAKNAASLKEILRPLKK
ncbi:MAG: YebG family protein [Desulfobacteraceae bacterium]|nr:YebG family protein [Desulfobacteraceae bacterium]